MAMQLTEFTYGINRYMASKSGKRIPNIPSSELRRESDRILGIILSEVLSKKTSGVVESRILQGAVEFKTHPSKGFTYRFMPSKEHIVTMDFGVPADGVSGNLKRVTMSNDLSSMLYDKMDKTLKPQHTASDDEVDSADSNTIADPSVSTEQPTTSQPPVEAGGMTAPQSEKANLIMSGVRSAMKKVPHDGSTHYITGVANMLLTVTDDKGKKSVTLIAPTLTKDPPNRHPFKYLFRLNVDNIDMSNKEDQAKIFVKIARFVLGTPDKTESRQMLYPSLSIEQYTKMAKTLLNTAIQRSNTRIASTGNGDDVFATDTKNGVVKVITTRDGDAFNVRAELTSPKDKTAYMIVHMTLPKSLKRLSPKNSTEITRISNHMRDASNDYQIHESIDMNHKLSFNDYYYLEE